MTLFVLTVLATQKRGKLDLEWLKRLRQRTKISFSRDRFDRKLDELEKGIGSLHKIRGHVVQITSIDKRHDGTSTITARMSNLQGVQNASSRLHEVLSDLWQCEKSQEHVASISLDDNKYSVEKVHDESQVIHFEMAW